MPDPTLFGRYRVDRRLGSGAFATVWLAHDDLLDSPVAVKLLAENWTDRLDIRSRFADEARILRRADSDHVVRVHDIGELEDGRPYFVMTYADGGTLADRLTGPLPEPEVVRHALGVAEGLAVLHRLGVVHRDVKPSNVLFHAARGTERLLIADLGLARAVAHASGFTLAAGTPGYMAPEQGVMGGAVDARADVYALGALITHMLTGHTPRTVSDERSAIFALQDADVIPGRLGEVVRHALAPHKEQRYPSAVEMSEELRQIGRPPVRQIRPPVSRVEARPPTLVRESPPRTLLSTVEPPPPIEKPVLGRQRVFRSRTRRRRLLGTATALAVVAAAGGGYAIWRTETGNRVVSGDGVSVTVPRSWSGQVKTGPWQLTDFGLPGKTGKGIEVSSDVAALARDGSTTAGVFVGVSTDLAGKSAASVLDHVRHPGCTRSSLSLPQGVSGTGASWSCAGGVRFDETVERRGADVVFVQVKESGKDSADAVLRSVKISS